MGKNPRRGVRLPWTRSATGELKENPDDILRAQGLLQKLLYGNDQEQEPKCQTHPALSGYNIHSFGQTYPIQGTTPHHQRKKEKDFEKVDESEVFRLITHLSSLGPGFRLPNFEQTICHEPAVYQIQT